MLVRGCVMPCVSVVIPTYNRAQLVQDAIRSVLQQTYTHFELIVVDDGSTDDTREQVAAFQRDPRVRYIYQENRGLSAARNAGIRAAQGEYIALLDSDDLWLPAKLEEQMNLLATDGGADVVYCDLREIDLAGNVLSAVWQRPPSLGTLYEDLMYGNVITGSGSSVLVRAKCFAQVGLFDEALAACEDQDLWRRMSLAQRKFVYLDQVLVHIRRHAANMQNDLSRMARARLQYLEKLRLETPSPFRHHLPEVAYLTYAQLAINYLVVRRLSGAARFSAKIVSLGPRYALRFLGELRVLVMNRLRRSVRSWLKKPTPRPS
jgi:glycosyltransferase involved in cell wall biosynthesis